MNGLKRIRLLGGDRPDSILLLINEDVTEHLAVSRNNHFKLFFQQSLDAISLNRLSDARYIDVNSEWSQLVGISREEAIGKTPWELNIVDETTGHKAMRSVRTRTEIRDIEFTIRIKDGTTRTCLVSLKTVHFDGEDCLLFFGKDITARKRAEQDLQESERRFRAIFEEAPEPITIVAVDDRRHVDINTAALRLFGAERDQVIGKTPFELGSWVSSEARDRFNEMLARDSQVRLLEADIRARDGAIKSCSISSIPIEFAGRPCILTHIRDITERKRAWEELARGREALADQERLRAIGELATGVAHDFNNILNVIQLRLLILKSDPAIAGAHADTLAALSRSVRDATVTIGRLQDSARQRFDRPLESLDVTQIVREAIDMTHTAIEEKSSLFGAPIRIESSLPSLPPVVGSPSEVRQVFVNLLLNAYDAMRAGGTIKIDATQRGNEIEVRVQDGGSGIAQEHLRKIFDPFFTTKGRGGSGMGLSIAYGVMKRLGGDISVVSPQQRGAVFTLTFPLAGATTDRRTNPLPTPSGVRRRIMVIDDDPDNLHSLRKLLQLKGHRVECFASGFDALSRLSQYQNFDVVLCDLGMPGMNGWEVAREIRRRAPGIAIYILTGWAQEIAEDEARRKSVQGILAKPIDGDEIDRVLSETERASTNGAQAASSDRGN